ncbi:MAG: leucine/isoleucine/valine transporter permease subunit, partial [Actinomycetia bacterium]|nr:leucine/isoleucine/valine transporter permease subunit [Actinomycetes bacterium]
MAEPTVAVEVPVAAEGELLAARQVDLWRAVRLGLVGGLTAAFVSANGMVAAFSERAVLGGQTLGSLLLVAVPVLVGYLAGRPPPVLQGFATPRPGWRNVAGGLVAGLLSGVVMAVFVTLIATFDVRRILINVTPGLVREPPRLLTFGLELGAGGLVLILALNAVLGAVAGTLHLLPARWRRAVFAAALWVLAFAMLQPVIVQVLRGIQAELRIWTAPLADFLYEPTGALSVPGAVAVAALAFGIHALLMREGRRPVRARLEPLPERSRRLLRLVVLAGILFVLGLLPQILGPFLSEVLNIAGIFLLMALGLNIVVGLAGLLDLGYVAFFAVGAYTTALLTSPQSSLGVGW